MRRFIVGGTLVLVGAIFIILVLAQNLFRVGTDFEEMTDGFRPVMNTETLDAYQEGVNGIAAAGDELSNQVVPALAIGMGMSPEQVGGLLEQQYPATAQGMAAIPQLSAEFNGIIGLLQSQQANFESADSIPTGDLPAQTVPWSLFILGIIALVLGAVALRGKVRLVSMFSLIVGVLALITLLSVNLLSKATDADDMNSALKPAYTSETVTGAQAGLEVLAAMGEEMTTKTIPGLAEGLGISTEEMMDLLSAYPNTAQVLSTLDESMASFTTLIDVFDQNLENYETIKPVDLSTLVWVVAAGALVMAAIGAFGVFWKITR
ncbi:MAG: hypothetical protein GY708_23460 [Actinomycetia bacterium]|nr:hypothetical protein [Actinomycetes bacterium]MCP4958881.1 hypothetical protein [Actinomycetes bacterium]